MGNAKTIVSGVAWTVINNIVSIVYGIISVPFLINYFGKEEYGLIGIALSVNVYIQLLDMGMTNSNVRFFSEFIAKKEENNVQRLFSLTHLFYLIVGLLNTVILFGLSFCIDFLFNVTPEQAITLRHLLWILALNATFSWVSACFDQLLTAKELLSWIKQRSAILKLLQFVILVFTILFKLSIEVYFFGYIFILTVILPLTIIKAHKVLPSLKFRTRYDNKMFHSIFPYAFSIFSFSIFQFCAFNFRPLFLAGLSGPASVAEFNVMNTIAYVVTILSSSFMQVLLPIITKMKVGADNSGIMNIMSNGTKYVTILLTLVIFLLIISMPEILALYVGEEYTGLSPWLCVWLATLLLSFRNVMTSLVFTERKIQTVAYMGAIAMVAALVCYLIFIPVFGVGGVVIGFAIHELIHTLFYNVYFLPRKFQIDTLNIFFKSVLPFWILGLSIGCIVILCGSKINMHSLVVIILKSIAFITCYAYIILKYFINKTEIHKIIHLLH